MSQYPPHSQGPDDRAPCDPYATLGYQPAGTPSKPGSITFVAVIAIVFGGLGSICTTFRTVAGVLQLAGVKLIAGRNGQVTISPKLKAFGVFDSVLDLGLYISLLAIGITALSLKPWARRAAVSWWAAVMIAWCVLLLILQLTWIGPATLEAVRLQMLVMGVVTLAIKVLPAVLFLAFWRRPSVVVAFEGAATKRQGSPDFPGK
jgi:hypothetical protein